MTTGDSKERSLRVEAGALYGKLERLVDRRARAPYEERVDQGVEARALISVALCDWYEQGFEDAQETAGEWRDRPIGA